MDSWEIIHDGYFKALSSGAICYAAKANRNIIQINSTIKYTDYIKPEKPDLRANNLIDNTTKRALIQGAGATLCFSLGLLVMVRF